MTTFVAYSLRTDAEHIAAVQEATLHRPGFGVAVTHGLFGSKDWWDNIAAGKLRTVTLAGTVSRVWMGSMGDWPMFELLADDGSLTTWTRHMSDRRFDRFYRQGQRVELDYVVQWFKNDATLLSARPWWQRLFRPPSLDERENKVVIEVRLGEE